MSLAGGGEFFDGDRLVTARAEPADADRAHERAAVVAALAAERPVHGSFAWRRGVGAPAVSSDIGDVRGSVPGSARLKLAPRHSLPARCPETPEPAFGFDRNHCSDSVGILNKRGDPDQVRLAEYLAIADDLLRPHHAALSGPLALRLDVGLPRQAGLLDRRDLDNYLLPLAARVSKNAAGALACVWGTKQHAARSYVRIEQAAPAAGAPPFDCSYIVRTTASSQSLEFKEEIRDQLGAATPLLPGPLRLQLSFTVGPARNWLNLWKQTIDALGQILGHAAGAGPWSPLDGRIVDLGLHCRVDPALGNEVLIAIAAQHVRP